MFNNNKVLVVIPAMNDSTNIPRKNVRLINEKPLIAYAIEIAKSSEYVDDIVVSSDDSETRMIADLFGATNVMASSQVEDINDLNAVVYDALIQKEKQAFDEYDIVVSLSPNSPLIKVESLNKAIEKFEDFGIDSVISVKEDKHYGWGYDDENKRFFPLYTQRTDKENLPLELRETDNFLLTRRNFLTPESFLGMNLDVVPISREESISVENYDDFWVAEKQINKKTIAIVVNAFDEIGTGHISRCLTLASKLVFHDVVFVLNQNYELGVNIIKSYNYNYALYDESSEILQTLEKINADLIINDVLDTSLEYISALKDMGYFVVNFQDLGPGIEKADLVFNAFYEHQFDADNVYTGHEYYLLRDEFYLQSPKIITDEVNNVLITFGGVDPHNLSEKVLQALIAAGFSKHINVILGVGYPNKQEIMDKYSIYNNIVIYEDVHSISEYMVKADIIFTSGSGTMYEACSLGVPSIILCESERELGNAFGNFDNGFINLGLGTNVDEEIIIENFNNLAGNFELRQEINQKMLAIDLKHGFENVWSKIKVNFLKEM